MFCECPPGHEYRYDNNQGYYVCYNLEGCQSQYEFTTPDGTCLNEAIGCKSIDGLLRYGSDIEVNGVTFRTCECPEGHNY